MDIEEESGEKLILTETEKLLVRRWLYLLQKHYRVYNIDYTHQCIFGDRGEIKIIRVFECVPNFFGCLFCGQYHICQLSTKTCSIISHEHQQDRLFCLYSGKYLQNSSELVVNQFTINSDNYSNLEQTGLSPTGRSLHSSSSSSSSTNKGERKNLYSNIRNDRKWIKTKRNLLSKETIKEEKELGYCQNKISDEEKFIVASDVKQKKNRNDKEKGDEENQIISLNDNDQELNEYINEEREEVNDTITLYDTSYRIKEYDRNYLYWSGEFSYLMNEEFQREENFKPVVEEIKIMEPVAMVVYEEKRISSSFSYNLITKSIEDEIVAECTLLIQRLLILPNCVQRKNAEKELILENLVDYFIPLIKNFYLLIHNSFIVEDLLIDRKDHLVKRGKYHQLQRKHHNIDVMTPKRIVESVILHLLPERLNHHDQCDNRIDIWVANPWTLFLSQEKLVDKYYNKFSKRNVAVRAQAEKGAVDIHECLTPYTRYSYWLKEFIHRNRRYD